MENFEKNYNKHICANCAIKHLSQAIILAKEILTGYDTPEYKIYLMGNLGEAQEQITTLDNELANSIRNVRIDMFPQGLQTRITQDNIKKLQQITLSISWRLQNNKYDEQQILDNNKASVQNYEKKDLNNPLPLTKKPCGCSANKISKDQYGKIDVIIPLNSTGSTSNNNELKYAIRSIDKHLKGFRDIYIISKVKPAGFDRCKWVYTSDDKPRKQMNIHNAIKSALNTNGISDNVIFWADDNVLMKDLDVTNFPVVSRTDDMMGFSNDSNARVWHRSVKNTAIILKEKGYNTINYEAHTPVVFNKWKYLNLEKEFDFYSDVGLCYISLYLNRYGVSNSNTMRSVKATFESDSIDEAMVEGKTFIGYNDNAVRGGIFKLFEKYFPEKSKFEYFISNKSFYDKDLVIGAVVGTYGTPAYIEMQLYYLTKINKIPVLVVDDSSNDTELLKSLCNRYGADFETTEQRYGHTTGDMQVFVKGLEWAKRNKLDLLVKISRTFIIPFDWQKSLIDLAKKSNSVTFSSYTVNYNKGFRTECMAMYVPAWYKKIEKIKSDSKVGEKVFVEKYMHGIAKELSTEYFNTIYEEYAKNNFYGFERTGYAFWFDVLGKDRKEPVNGVLWHDISKLEEYCDLANKIGLNYSANDFMRI